jgi:hypothetical protein
MANNIMVATVKIKGTRPILWNRFGPDAIPLEKQIRTGVAGNDPEEWKKCYLATKDGQLYIEPSYIFGCLRNAAVLYQKRKRINSKQSVRNTPSNRWSSTIWSFMLDELTQDSTEPVYLHIASVRNPNTKSRNIRYRVAASTGWNASFTIMWDGTVVSLQKMQAVVNDAGTLVGLADGWSIGFGRFEIMEFEMESYAKKASA